MCMIDGGEPYEYSSSEMRTARKPHNCGECRRTIKPGESYEYAKGVHWEYGWDSHKTCVHCVAAREWLERECNGFLYNGVLEDLEQHADEMYGGMRLGRLIVGMRRRWRKFRSGELMPIPKAA